MRMLSSRPLRALLLAALCLAVAGVVAAQSPAPLPSPQEGAEARPSEESEAPVREIEWYTAEVPVTSQESREREAALGRALAQVLVRVTGSSAAPNNAVVRKALRVAGTMASGTEYRDVEETVGGLPMHRQVLAASFDPDSIDALVMAAGLPLWAGARPRPMLWLAIDDGAGAGPRLVSAQQINVVKPLAQRGLERGLRFLLPGGTAVEQPAAGSIWALDPAAIGVLSSRYGGRVQLLGKLSRAGTTGWQAEWLLADGATELKRWTHVDPSPQRAIASGADQAADALAARQAKVIAAGRPEVLEAEIVGLGGQDRWLGLAAYLQALPVLRGYQIIEAQPDRLRVRLDLAVDRARFEALLEGGDRLAPIPDEVATATAMDDISAEPAAQPLVRYRLLP